MDKEEEQAIQKALEQGMQDMEFEAIPDIINSPINVPVKEGEVSVGTLDLSSTIEPIVNAKEDDSKVASEQSQQQPINTIAVDQQAQATIPDDAPQQIVDEEELDEGDSSSPEGYGVGENLELPEATAKMAANSLLGMSNNLLKIGGGFFVKIKKSKDLIFFKEIVQEIDDQNTKNINRIALDEEDQALLRPLLMQILKQRAKELTPEQQLIGAAISIVMKKVQLMASIKSENKLLEHKFQQMINNSRTSTFQPQEPIKKEEPEEEEQEVEDSEMNAEITIIETHDGTIDLSNAA